MAQGTKVPPAANTAPSNGVLTGGNPPGTVGVNRKKQKRRAKQAARQAAEQQHGQDLGTNVRNGHVPQGHSTLEHTKPLPHVPQQALDYEDPDFDDPDQFEPADGDDLYYTDDEAGAYHHSYNPNMPGPNGHLQTEYSGTTSGSKKPKKKKRTKSQPPNHPYEAVSGSSSGVALSTSNVPPPPPPPPPLSETAAIRPPQPRHTSSKDRIWNTSTQEERERIKEFWLSLGEDERKSLVKIEKEAVLRKMKEQQKHSCSCTVCGRKRTAIEEELEVLYDAYYEELEQYANHQQGPENGAPMLPPPRRFAHPMGRMPPDRMPPLMNAHPPSRNRIRELADDEDEDEEDEEGDDEEYSDEDDEDDYSDDEPEELPRGPAADFFQFGNSLTVKGGILTVADDLLKNDGKKFIEMMEQLAERRMQREEEAQFAASGLSHPMQNPHAGHDHGAPPDEDDYDEDDEEEYDSQEEDYEDDDETDTMTEEQRMEEGRRMFQIFAARMFEQRVLTAYREKVARERQQKLLEELEEENRLGIQREAKKARDAQKKKEKKALQKQKLAEEKARKEAEKAAEEAAAKAVEQQRQEEQKRKKEEQRKKKEAERKAQEEERQKREAEKQKRMQEERERQQEAERKLREQKAQEKKAREEAKKKEREEREAREKEAKERKALEEKKKREREAKVKAEKESKERARKDEQAQASHQTAPSTKRVSQTVPVALPPGLHKQSSAGFPSPLVQVATPAIPKAPTPVKPRQSSQQGSHASSPKTPQVGPGTSKSASPSNAVPTQSVFAPKAILTKPPSQQPTPLPHPQPSSPMHPIGPPPGMHPPPGPGFAGIPPGMNGFPQNQGPLPGMGHRPSVGPNMPIYPQQPPPIGSQFRSYGAPGVMPPPPGMNGLPMMPHGRGFPLDAPPGFAQPIPGIGANQGPSFGGNVMPSHSRQHSASFEKPGFEQPLAGLQTQPIARPTPIQRPSSVRPQEGGHESRKVTNAEIDDLGNHLGSSALLDDTDEPIPEFPGTEAERRASIQTSMPRNIRMGFGSSPLFADPASQPRMDSFGLSGSAGTGSAWGTPTVPFGPVGGAPGWGNSPTHGGLFNNAFGVMGNQHRPSISRPVLVRRMVCQACKDLTATKSGTDGFHEANTILQEVNLARAGPEAPVQLTELMEICETEGDSVNGGGMFTIKREGANRTMVKFEEGEAFNPSRTGPGVGEIGSPLPGHSMPVGFNSPRPFAPLGGVSSPNF